MASPSQPIADARDRQQVNNHNPRWPTANAGHLLTQLLHPIPQVGRFFEIELLGRLLHLGLELIDQLRQRLQRQPASGSFSRALAALPTTSTRSASGPSCLSLRLSSRKLRIELLAFLPAAVGTTPFFSL